MWKSEPLPLLDPVEPAKYHHPPTVAGACTCEAGEEQTRQHCDRRSAFHNAKTLAASSLLPAMTDVRNSIPTGTKVIQIRRLHDALQEGNTLSSKVLKSYVGTVHSRPKHAQWILHQYNIQASRPGPAKTPEDSMRSSSIRFGGKSGMRAPRAIATRSIYSRVSPTHGYSLTQISRVPTLPFRAIDDRSVFTR